MEAHVTHSWLRKGWDVWLYERIGGQTHGYSYDVAEGFTLDREAMPPGADPGTPTLRLPDDALEAIVRALPGKVTANDATLDALIDARTVRDRLLTLVERGW